MAFLGMNKLYGNVFDTVQLNIDCLKVKIVFKDNDYCVVTLKGDYDLINYEKSPLDGGRYPTFYAIRTGEEILQDLLDSEWILDDGGNYYNTKENSIKKVEILERFTYQAKEKLFIGVETIGDDDE